MKNKTGIPKSQVVHMDRKGLCPFVGSSSEECFCTNTTSVKILSVIKFCMGNFEQCEIYKRFVETDSQ